MVCLGDEQRSFCRFWDCIQVLHFRLFCWPWWLLHFFWGIPARSSRCNGHLSKIHPFQSILVRWFLKCRSSPLPSLVWPFPIYLDSWTWHSRFLCNIALHIIGPCFYHQSHPQLGTVFALAPSLHSFWSYFSTDLQEHTGHLPTWGVPLSVCPVFLPFHTVHGVLKARIVKWFAIPFSSGPHSVRPVHHDPPILGCPAGMAWFH